MKLQFSIERAALQAVAMCAADKDIRHYLNGVLLDIRGPHLVLVATDGHRLAAYRHPDDSVASLEGEGDSNTEWLEVIMPISMARELTKGKAALTQFPCEFDSDTNTLRALNLATMGWIEYPAVEGKFPDYRRVIPRGKLSGIASQFNADYLADFGKMMRCFSKRGVAPTIEHDRRQDAESGWWTDGAARVVFEGQPNFIGVLMPTHWDGEPDSDTSWVYTTQESERLRDDAIKQILANDENSTDADLVAHLVTEFNLTQAQAEWWIEGRQQYRNAPLA